MVPIPALKMVMTGGWYKHDSRFYPHQIQDYHGIFFIGNMRQSGGFGSILWLRAQWWFLLMVVGDFKGTVFFSFLTARPMFPTVKVPLAVRELSRELVPMSPKCTTHFIDTHIFARCDPICIFLSLTQNVTLWIHDHTDIVVTLNNKSIHFRRFGNPCQTHCCFHVSAHKWHLLATQVHFALMKPGHGLESCISCASERY